MNMFPPAQTKAVCTLENHPRQPSDCAIYVFMKIDDDESMKEGSATIYSKNEQVCISSDGGNEEEDYYGIVVENEQGSDIDGPDENAMVDVETTYAVRVVGGQVRTGIKGSNMTNIREQWLLQFGTAKVYVCTFILVCTCFFF
jgi:hypothetical protein